MGQQAEWKQQPCVCLQSADKEAKVSELLREADQLEREHAREVKDIEDNHAQELTEAQRKHEDEVQELERQQTEDQRDHEDEVAQLESRVALLERELEGLRTQETNMQKLQAAHVSLHALMMMGVWC